MLEQANELEQIEVSIEEAQKEIATRDVLARLIKNKDFQAIIDDGYFDKEAIRLVHLKSDRNVQDPEEQAYIDKAINSIGFFRNYLHGIFQRGNAAARALKTHETTREEILNEGLNEEGVE